MKWHTFPRSPEFPRDHKWPVEPRADAYESEVDALVRAMLADPAVRDDQRLAWDRWWFDPSALRKAAGDVWADSTRLREETLVERLPATRDAVPALAARRARGRPAVPSAPPLRLAA